MQLDLSNSVIFKKIVDITKNVNNQLNQKGIAIPVQNDDGSIAIGYFSIVKEDNFFTIRDFQNQIVVDKINLPQTAILLANGLALGKFIDHQLIEKDRRYGFAVFEEKRYSQKSKKKDLDRYSLFKTKLIDAKLKKELYKRSIIDKFKKFEKIYK